MSLLYAKERFYKVKFRNNGSIIKINVDGNIGKFGCDEPILEWEGSVMEFVEMLAKDYEDKDL